MISNQTWKFPLESGQGRWYTNRCRPVLVTVGREVDPGFWWVDFGERNEQAVLSQHLYARASEAWVDYEWFLRSCRDKIKATTYERRPRRVIEEISREIQEAESMVEKLRREEKENG